MKSQSSIILKITFLRQLRGGVFIPEFWFLGLLIWVIYTAVDLNKEELNLSIIIFAILAGIFLYSIIPTFFLHRNYLKRNRNEEYEIGNKTIIRRKDGIETIYDYDDIERIYLYRSSQRDDIKSPAWAYNYHYIKIIMKSGEELYLTSLLYSSDLEKVLKNHIKLFYYNVKHHFVLT